MLSLSLLFFTSSQSAETPCVSTERSVYFTYSGCFLTFGFIFFFYGKVEADRGRVQCSHTLLKTNDERYGQEITAPTALKIFKSVAKIEC